MPTLVIPGLRPDLHGIDLVVQVFWPARDGGDTLGACSVRPADGSSFGFPVACVRGQEDVWEALRIAYEQHQPFRAVAK